ncbi:amino acid adenylation domain-containing protein [Tumebacillus sp. BK434]|uniref:non-ribosomal peptide synthetase n=1 Tax=Tumebacillus sp. BK434 TaxID=2512169 RepID=UPI00104B218A|nr:non-ribosomal peptide synthetase [Tumebacillus sp. BK434]TCP59425.1 amino acid adenylation domain-containing protein [Tumebacillus sp. BK434]
MSIHEEDLLQEEGEETLLPASFSQQRMWFIDQFLPGQAIYNIPCSLRLTGQLRQDILAQSILEVMQRHEALRTTFEEIDGELTQVIVPDGAFHLPLTDLTELPPAQREAQATAIITLDACQPFDLFKGPLLRGGLIRLSEQEHLLFLNMHHIISDGWSLGVLVQEIGALYTAFAAGLPSPLPELPIQYGDFADWQNEWLQGEVLDEQLSYWRRQLDGELPVLQLPTDRPRPPVQTFNGSSHAFQLSQELTVKLNELSRREGTTLFITLLAAFNTLLYRYTGQNDLTVGTPIAGRSRGETERLIGLFINTLVLRSRVSGTQSFAELLQAVSATVLEAYNYQDLPFEKLVEELQPDRNMSHPPLFQVMFVLQNAPLGKLELPGLTLETVEVSNSTAKLDLTLAMVEKEQGLYGVFEYNTDLFNAATIERFSAHFLELLEGITSDPQQQLAALPLATAAERRQVFTEWNRTEAPVSTELLHTLFYRQVPLHEDKIAVRAPDRALTYRELFERSNQVGHRLHGVAKNTLVAVVMEKGWEQVVAVYGILAAGAAYLPIDPKAPEARILHLLDYGQVRYVLTQSHLLDRFNWPEGVAVIAVDSTEIEAQRADLLPVVQTPEDLAYVIFTSGSTGQPKGVVIDHQGAVNTLLDMNSRFAVTPDDKVFGVSSLGFDLSVYDIFGTLAAGGTLVLPEADKALDPAHWADLLFCHGITVWNSAPALAKLLAEYAILHKKGLPSCLRLVWMSGDWIPLSLPVHLQELVPGISVHSLGGATEASIWSITFPIEQVDPNWTSIPYGRPMANQKFFVFNEALEPCPPGVTGDLYIGGIGLAVGYWRDEEKTNASFLTHPQTGQRIYRTGDQGRYRPDGVIEFMGRVDNQVKIRGFRIELGEIEVTLTRHPLVQEAVVLVREDVPGDRRLVAYVVPVGCKEPDVQELRALCKSKLPDYMVPSAFLLLPSLPVTSNGKLDRKALPVPDRSLFETAAEHIAPTTPLEMALAELWSEVLGLERVSVRANFFELGGHSLLATQLITRAGAQFEIDLPLRTLFEAPTIEELARCIEGISAGTGDTGLTPLVQTERADGTAPLSFAQERMWFVDRLEGGGSAAYNIPLTLRLTGELNFTALHSSFQEILSRHETLRTTFQLRDGQPVQVIADALELEIPLLDLRGEADRQAAVAQTAAAEAKRPYDLSRDALFRVTLLQLGDEEHVLLLNMHHIISDGWSIGVLVREFTLLYEAFVNGAEPALPELPVQFADFAVWQRQHLQGAVLDGEVTYWKTKLGGELPRLQLPTDPAVQPAGQSANAILQLPAELTGQLKALSADTGATLFMTVLAAYKLLLARLSGQEDIIVGTPIAGRSRVETEPLIGMFLNTLALRTDLSGNPTFRELLGRVRETTLGAYAHQELPFEKIVEELQPERALNRNPIFDVLINYLNMPVGPAELPGLHLETIGVEAESKFLMTLYLYESDEGLAINLVYQTDHFNPARIDAMLDQFRHLLVQAAGESDRRVGDYSLRTKAAQGILPDPSVPLEEPAHELVHEAVAAWAVQTPSRTAVEQGAMSWSYEELQARATDIAHHLLATGLQREEKVALLATRSFGCIAAMLGVFLAGGVLVAIDRGLPAPRKEQMLQAAGAARLLSVCEERSEGAHAIISPHSGRIQGVDAPSAGLLPEVQREDAAYLFFTSGTTGVPKGVLGTHKGMSHFLHWQRETFGVTPDDKSAQLTHLSFDVVLRDIFLPLTSGATLCLPPVLDDLCADTILPWLDQSGVTILHTVPSLAQSWLQGASADAALASLRCLFSAGEPLTDSFVNAWRDRFPGAGEIINLYGPTETTLAKCYYVVPPVPHAGIQPVGHTLPETQALILSAAGQLCGIGEAGEIVIRTPFRTRGYLTAGDESAARFVANPFSPFPNDLLYRTGDRGLYRPDGTLDILGRVDDQVKIRGVRIQLTEIAALLAQHPAVTSSAVLDWKDDGMTWLAAYVTAREGETLTAPELRFFLEQRLPAAMVPSAYVVLDRLPLTSNGKVDRKALPKPEQRTGSAAYEAPCTEAEQALADIWQDVLQLERAGRSDHFFEAGGHSLLAMQVITRIRQVCGVELPLRAVFECPTLERLAARIDEARRGVQNSSSLKLQKAARDSRLPLSFAQQRLWFIDQLEPNSSVYNIPINVRLTGPLAAETLERSFAELLQRHEALRTNIITREGVGEQVIRETAALYLPRYDISQLSEAERDAKLHRLLESVAREPFSLADDLLIRAALIRTGVEEHVVAVAMHHIISDGWSLGLFVREMGQLYHAFRKGEPSPLSELPFQYADYAVWQRDWLQGEARDQQLRYWKDRLGGNLPVLELPTDHPRTAKVSYAGTTESIQLPQELVQALEELTQQSGATLYMTLLAAFNTLLYRYAGQTDIILGTPVAGRTERDLEGLIGFFVNTLALRSDLSGNPTFRELLLRVKEVALGAFAHQELPLEELIDELQLDRDLSRNPLFQVMFVMQNMPPQAVGLASELELDVLEVDRGTAKFDLTLTLVPGAAGWSASFEYKTGLFTRETIRRMCGHLLVLLQGIAANPDQTLDALPLLTAAEEHRLLIEWNDTEVPFPEDKLLHVLFEEQVLRTPDRIAADDSGNTLTYAELDRRANQLARHLQTYGVGPDVAVGVCVERSLELVIALVGILKAGGAYLPIDTEAPTGRIAQVLDDAGAPVVLALENMRGTLPAEGAEPLFLDAGWHQIAKQADTKPHCAATPDHLVSIYYTSGSTGKPKGVANLHRGWVNRMCWMQRQHGLQATESVLQKTTLTFDDAAVEFYWPLMVGAKIVLLAPKLHRDPRAILDAAVEHKVAVLQFVPSMLAMVIDSMTPADRAALDSVRVVVSSGEALRAELVRQFLEKMPGQLHNTWGATEVSIDSTIRTCSWEDVSEGEIVSVGRPIDNNTCYVLDRNLRPVPIGVAGDLYLGGVGLARGYFNSPERTAQAFLPHPFAPGEQLYKTGDRGYFKPDGQIKFLGREDDQIKIRGMRVELGEIESVLDLHEAVKSCVVAAHEYAPGDKRLAAYVVLQDDAAVTTQELRAFLKAKLPDYMVPPFFLTLERLPLTANGKVDRKALPLPGDLHVERDNAYAPPRDAVEAKLAAIWEELLDIRPVGIADNFFALGGHSILAVRLISRVQQEFGRQVPLAALFQEGTIGHLATFLQEDEPREASPLVPIRTAGDKTPLFLFHPGTGNVLAYYELARLLPADQPVYGLQAPALEADVPATDCVAELAACYVRHLRSVQPQGPYLFGGWSFGGVLAYEAAQQLRAAGETVQLLAMLDAGTPVEAGAGELLSEAEFSVSYCQNMAKRLKLDLSVKNDQLDPDNIEAVLHTFLELGKTHNILPHDFGYEQFRRMLRVSAAHERAAGSYRPVPFPGDMTLFRAAEQPEGAARTEALGWETLVQGSLTVQEVPGDHDTIVAMPHVLMLAEQLSSALQRAHAAIAADEPGALMK